ncbi:MAG TPA: hypothetical protein VFT64_12250 [Rickettsiales bacterium]|nr:hypothetical protein [Rickettsiales bacterium]
MAHSNFLRNSFLVTVILLSACSQKNTSGLPQTGTQTTYSTPPEFSTDYVLSSKSSPNLSLSSVCGKKIPEKNCPIISPPTTPVELLKNIKSALALNLFLKDDIYTNDELLWKIFAVREFLKEYPFENGTLVVRAGRFPVSIDQPALHVAGVLTPNIQIIKSRSTYQNAKKVKVSFGIRETDAFGLSIADVEAVFGPDWKYYTPSMPGTSAHHESPAPSNRITYLLKGKGNVSANVLISFDKNKKMHSLSIGIEE